MTLIFLEKINTPDSSKLLAKMDELGLTRSLSFSLTAAVAKEKDEALAVVTEKKDAEKTPTPVANPKALTLDTIATPIVEEIIDATPSYVLMTNTTAYKTIEPSIINKSKSVAYIAMKNIKLNFPTKPIAKAKTVTG